MEIGIVTILDNCNYGNRLQNYAVCRLVKEMGGEPLNLGFLDCGEDVPEVIRRLYGAMPKKLYPQIQLIKEILLERNGLRRKRKRRFMKFTAETMPVRCMKGNASRDYYITGSDQVWNPHFAGTDKYFLQFAPAGKRLAFSASMGVSEIPMEMCGEYTRKLKEMQFISVREHSAASIVEQLTGTRPEVWPDPTMLVDTACWRKLAKKPDLDLPEEYILSFFLGEEPEEILEHYGAKLKRPVIRLENEQFPEYYCLDPAEFLYMIEHAKLVLTDSFHATVFSVKFKSPFYVFRRKQAGMEGMFSRMEELLERFGMQERYRERSWQEAYAAPEMAISPAVYEEIDKKLAADKEHVLKTFTEIFEKRRLE